MSTHDDIYDSFGADLDAELDALEQDIDFTDSAYGAVSIYGAAATVDIPKLTSWLLYPSTLRSALRMVPSAVDPVEANAKNLALEIARAIELKGYPSSVAERAQFLRSVALHSILPDMDDAEYDAIINSAIRSDPGLLEALRAAFSAGPEAIAAWYMTDLPAMLDALNPVSTGGHQVVNEYAAYLYALSIAGFDVFEEIAQAAAANGAILTDGGAQEGPWSSAPGPGWEPEAMAPPKSGILGDIQPATILGVGYALTIGIPVIRSIF